MQAGGCRFEPDRLHLLPHIQAENRKKRGYCRASVGLAAGFFAASAELSAFPAGWPAWPAGKVPTGKVIVADAASKRDLGRGAPRISFFGADDSWH